MSHIHIPDGVMPLWLWMTGYILAAIYFIFGTYYIKKFQKHNKLPLVSIMTALMLLTMSVPIPFPVPYHINLSVLSGIILGPILSFFAVFTTNLLLAFIAHGGITAVGLNTVVISFEAAAGYYIFRFLLNKTKKLFMSSFTSTLLALIISSLLAIGVIYAGTHNCSAVMHHHDCCCHHELSHNAENFDIKRFFSLMFLFGSIGWILEATFTGFIVNYINKVKPDLIEFKEKKDENS